MVMPVPSRRKQPPIINRWYLTFYLRNHRLWAAVLAAGTIGFAILKGLDKIWGDAAQLAWPLLIGSALVWAGSVLWRIYRTREVRNRADQSIQPVTVHDFESFLRRVKLPADLAQAGYSVREGGVARDLYKHHQFSGFSATSTTVNRALRNRSGAGASPCQVEIPIRVRTLGDMLVGSWLVRSLAARFGWHWLLVRRWRLPLISQEIMYTVISGLPTYASGSLANERKIRLGADLLPPVAERWPLQMERTDYLSDLVTGHITGVKVLDQSGNDIFDGYANAFDRSGPQPLLKGLAHSSCSNQIGVSGMTLGVSGFKGKDGALDLHGHLYFVGQSMENLASAGLIAPSGSGSLDWSDLSDAGDDFIAFGMWREMLEETWSGSWNSLTERGHFGTVITGYARMLHRGGKPEFYGLMVMPRGADEHAIDESEQRYAAESMAVRVYPLTAKRLTEVTQHFMSARRDKLSHPLFMCLTLLIDYLADEPDHFAVLVQRSAQFVQR